VRKTFCAQFELTPKALANFSPGFEHSENPGYTSKESLNPERVRQLVNPFRVTNHKHTSPGLSLRSNPGLTLANAFGVKFKLRHYLRPRSIDQLAYTTLPTGSFSLLS
jgi:hypothetical protein